MKVLFMGTPEFAAESLNALLLSNHTVVGVISQPDRALKHGKSELSAVKKLAIEKGLPIFQPKRIRDEVERLKEFGADIAVTAAYGQLLSEDVLRAFSRGVLNVHASLLPKYRGASPIQAAIANGERKTGVTIMRTELGLDTGDMLSTVETDIGDMETAGELTERLARLGAELLVKTLDELDCITPVKQDDEKATHCRTITKAEQHIDFTAEASAVVNRIRSLSPSPCAKTVIGGEIYKIYRARAVGRPESDKSAAVGEILQSDDKLVIACGKGAIEVLTIQAPSKRMLDISDFLRGKKFEIGDVCAKP
ncbi:MAG: methionyl-tRNA formyltransferase [Clostridiales bacterium]|nr:methionyl-tRNA formyltransferase [Clostridiales bacterium]